MVSRWARIGISKYLWNRAFHGQPRHLHRRLRDRRTNPMTPEERNLVADLFDRLARLEESPRDREAERLIQDGLRQAPNATYALVQTTLIRAGAPGRADPGTRVLEARRGAGGGPPRRGGFLESMRESMLGRREPARAGSVPTVRPGGESAPMGAPPS